MTPQEIGALLAYADRLAPRYAPQDAGIATERYEAFRELLADVPATAPHPDGRDWNAAHAVKRHLAESPYPLQASDVTRPWLAFKADVMRRHTDPLPAADPDDPESWRAELLGTRHAVAAGQRQATTYRELAAAPADALRARLARVGEMPPAVREQIRQATGGRIGAGKQRFPELAVPCPREDCRALHNMPCKRPSGKELREHTHPQRQQAYAALLARESA